MTVLVEVTPDENIAPVLVELTCPEDHVEEDTDYVKKTKVDVGKDEVESTTTAPNENLMPVLIELISHEVEEETESLTKKEDVAGKNTNGNDESIAQEAKQEIVPKESMSTSVSTLSEPLPKDFCLLSKRQRELMLALCASEGNRVHHLFQGWTKSQEEGTTPAFRRRLVTQLENIDVNYPSGLIEYLRNLRGFLKNDGNKDTYLKGWNPEAPLGETFEIGTEDYSDVEKLGKRELSAVGFVLAAGAGKLCCTLPIELATRTSYLQLYVESILAIEKKYANGAKLPLCIITSDSMFNNIVELLKENDNFGITEEQITILNQGPGVPALSTADAKLVLKPKDPFNVITKTHGQGDVHALLHKNGVARKWKKSGTEWIFFLEDTNGLAFHNIALMLGMSVKHSLVMNTLAFPRKAGEAVESIVKLVNEETKGTRTISVAHDQLNCLLQRSADQTDGDSVFPGSTNQFVFNLDKYVATLEKTNGILPEFAVTSNDGSLTHLECRMQDISSVLSGRDALKVGYTCVVCEHSFSPIERGTLPRCVESAEADQYASHRNVMSSLGCQIEDAEPHTVNGINVTLGPQIVIKPDAACFPSDYAAIFPNPDKVKISARSSLVISGPGVVIESLELDGALVVKGNQDLEEQNIKGRNIKNDGWIIVVDEDSIVENKAMRGYSLEKNETETIVFHESLMETVARLTTCG